MKCSWLAARSGSLTGDHFCTNWAGVIFPEWSCWAMPEIVTPNGLIGKVFVRALCRAKGARARRRRGYHSHGHHDAADGWL